MIQDAYAIGPFHGRSKSLTSEGLDKSEFIGVIMERTYNSTQSSCTKHIRCLSLRHAFSIHRHSNRTNQNPLNHRIKEGKFSTQIMETDTSRTYQQTGREYFACCRCDVLHEDTYKEVLCRATPCASSKFQTPQAQDKELNIQGRQAN